MINSSELYLLINTTTQKLAGVYHMTYDEFVKKVQGLVDNNYEIYAAKLICKGTCRSVMFLEHDIHE